MLMPLIGITTRNSQTAEHKIPLIASPHSYTEALIHAGAIPVLVPLNLPADAHEQLLARLDGVVFTGGGDIMIEHFGGEAHEAIYGLDNERDVMELGFYQQVKQAGKPVLGICRGLQLINVAEGGTLYTHVGDQLADAVKHDFFPPNPFDLRAHAVQIAEDSRLAAIVGEPLIEVNSVHHQGIQRLGAGLRVMAKAPDGLIEAIEIEDHPFGIAVQWHPEWLPGDGAADAIVAALVDAARGTNGR